MKFFLKLFLAFIAITLHFSAFAQNDSVSTPLKIAMIESLSGPFGNTGEAVYRNLLWATERVNARAATKGGVKFELKRYDSKGQSEEATSALRSAIDDGAHIIMQGNSSAVAAVLIDAINKHNEREPNKRVLFLNYSAIDPALTNEKCSPWHFRFDAHVDMRMKALVEVLKEDQALKSIYIIGQDYSFGHAVAKEAKRQLALQRPDVAIVGEELHPIGRIKDFLPYAAKIKATGAQAVLTGNFGNDLTLLVKSAKEAGFDGKFYTFFGNALGAPAAIGDAGVGKVVAVADWLPNVPTPGSEAFYQAFKVRFPNPADDYVHMRMQLMMEALAQAVNSVKLQNSNNAINIVAIQAALKRAMVAFHGQSGEMRGVDHQFQQPLVVGLMDKQVVAGVKFDVEGSGYGFRVIKQISAKAAELSTTCKMPLVR
ncbi:MAG TPA: branched-chain amino acid ABC transporter substrate-binding protein [Burkholderiaceae bacterium]|nr:branched-chain amino acid ABC transporter substrate-binding protein [Burkholderiaceae bacterium]